MGLIMKSSAMMDGGWWLTEKQNVSFSF